MSKLHRVRSENQRLREENFQLNAIRADLESQLEMAESLIVEFEAESGSANVNDVCSSDEERMYIASSKRRHFHRPSCEYAMYIVNSPNLIEFSSHAEAVAAGYKPCKTCRA